MRRLRIALCGAAITLTTITLTAPSGAALAASDPVHVARSFTVLAEAYPTQSAPGSQETEITVRPASTKAVASNPPVAAFARAIAADLGLAEAYLGSHGPAADADTATRGDEDDVVIDEGGSRMEAHVDQSPRAWSIARSNSADSEPGGSGTVASASSATAGGRRILAIAAAEVHDFRAGPFVLGSGRFDGTASIDGTPGGGRASGLIRTSDATYDGIPITIGADGVRVDESRIPDPMLQAATAAIQEAFSPGGFADVRVVQPSVEIAEDGTSARVSGGGIHLFFTNNDPKERYFVSYTLLGGTATATLGGVLSQPTPDRLDAVVRPRVGRPAPPSSFSNPAPRPAATPAAVTPEPALTLASGSEQITLQSIWRGWILVLALVALGWTGAGALQLPALAPTRRRLDHLVGGLADRYLRG